MGVLALEEALDAAVGEPQPGLHLQDRLPGDGEPEVARFDEPGMDGADRDLIHAGSVDLDEREWPSVFPHRGWRPGVVAHRVPPWRPVLMQDEAAQEGMPGRDDAEQVAHLALEPAGGEGGMGQGGYFRPGGIEPDLQFGPPVRGAG